MSPVQLKERFKIFHILTVSDIPQDICPSRPNFPNHGSVPSLYLDYKEI